MLNSVPDFPKFRYIRLNDKKLIDHLIDQNYLFSEVIFSNLYGWRLNSLKTMISHIDGTLVLKTCDISRRSYNIIVLSENYQNIDDILSNYIFKQKHKYNVLLPEEAIKFLDSKYSVTEDVVNNEYIYSVSDIAKLSGNRFGVARANVNKFKRNYPNCNVNFYSDFTGKNSARSLIKELFYKWIVYKNGIHATAGNFELEALNYLLMHSKLYNLKILSIFDAEANHIVGFASIELSKNKQMAYICFAKTDHKYKGASEMLLNSVAKYLESINVEEFNFEQDLGIESLRNYKLKLRPKLLHKVYIVKPSE